MKRIQLKLWPRICRFPGCQKKTHTHGLCVEHWNSSPDEKERARQKRGTLNGKYSSLKQKAKKYSRHLSITLDEYATLTVNRNCFYCDGVLPPMGHGLDRLDGSKGYSIQNCVPCCSLCNSRKGMLEAAGLEYPETVEIMKRLTRKQIGANTR